jgi:hypothetical protein
MPRTLKRPEQPINPYLQQPLPVDRPAAVYYRQSSEHQIGNISTTLQTVDMIERVLKQGWVRENVYMIDMDAGVSGSKKIRERKGMSMLFDMIESGQIGMVAAQDVDRFFRDITMIETNMFIDACKRNNVQVMTPNTVYDFAHPIMGQPHIKMFREEAQRAADYIEYQIRGRLVKARNRHNERGMWAGRKILPGFMMDNRPQLSNGATNPDYRKYKRFEPYADVVKRYFEIFRELSGNFSATWLKIDKEGPYFPDLSEGALEPGFQVTDHLDRRSIFTGGLTPSQDGLRNMLVNVAYIGHWIHKGAITQFNNHEAIIDLDLFMYAFNKISPVDFYGDPNPDYIPYRPWIRHNKDEREEAPPTYAYLAYSDDLPERPHQRLSTSWGTEVKHYKYQLSDYPYRTNVWNIKASIVDGLVDEMLLERLQATTIDEALWQAALAGLETVDQADVRRVQTAIRQAEATKDNIIASLGLLTNPEMVKRAQARYEATEHEIDVLQADLRRIQSNDRKSRSLVDARPVLQAITARWSEVPGDEKRHLFEQFAQYINITKITRHTKRITVHWRDGSTSERSTTHKSMGYFWDEAELNTLRTMIETSVDQWEILRAFPNYTWRALQERYSYNFGNGLWYKDYKGKKPYNRNKRWSDTVEYQSEESIKGEEGPQVAINSLSTDPYKYFSYGHHHARSPLNN